MEHAKVVLLWKTVVVNFPNICRQVAIYLILNIASKLVNLLKAVHYYNANNNSQM